MKAKFFATAATALVALAMFAPTIASAHQPRIVRDITTVVTDPEISKAYYGSVDGEQRIFSIHAPEAFDLYVNILVPDIPGQQKDMFMQIIKGGNTTTPFATMGGTQAQWKHMWEDFGHDYYWQGPEYKVHANPGDYEIRVWSGSGASKYALAIGETEHFDFAEIVNALTLVPKLKSDYFEKSPADFLLSPFGAGYVAAMFLIAFVVGFLYRAILRAYAKRNAVPTPRGIAKNIGKRDRIVRALIGVVLFVWAVTTSWSPILLFFSGFTFFEAIFSWCGFYAALGRSTCPIE